MSRDPLAPKPITRELNSTMVTAALTMFDWPDVDLQSAESVKTRIKDYFTLCDNKGMRPSNLGLYASLGMSKQDVHAALTRPTQKRVSPACCDLIKKARFVLSSYREQLAIAGKVSPPVAIFWAKNFDGMEDITRVELSADKGPTADMTPEQIAAQIERDIPIDTEYKDIDQG